MFNVGDAVEVTAAGMYGITTKGSWGYVVEILPHGMFGYTVYQICFEEITSEVELPENPRLRTFSIHGDHVGLRERGEVAVIRKIKAMERKRKELGYQW